MYPGHPQVVQFNYSEWALYFPELAGSITSAQAQLYFNRAQLFCDNSPCSIIQNLCEREILLNLATAHVATLMAPLNGAPSSPLVGRINNATEGSVTVATQLDVPTGCPQYLAQSKYGIEFYNATAKYRMMSYVPGPRSNPASFIPGRR